MENNSKQHWEGVYQTKLPEQLSWTQAVPDTSILLIHLLEPDKTASIIDVGGGDSTLVDHLLAEGYQNITVLDVSGSALERAKQRLGSRAQNVKWIEADITNFEPVERYDLWHDRAVFHFLTTDEQLQAYLRTLTRAVEGHLVVGTFSEKGPEQCSGLPVRRYSQAAMQNLLVQGFESLGCHTEDHRTPFNTQQNFLYCRFKKRAA